MYVMLDLGVDDGVDGIGGDDGDGVIRKGPRGHILEFKFRFAR